MKQKLIFAWGMICLPLLTGCLEYEEQTMTFRHDGAADTLYIFQDYRGIFGVDDPVRLSSDEVEQMDSVMRGGRTFFFNNWITEFHRARLEEMKQTPPGELDDDPAYESAVRAAVDAALANVRVENVGFYYDAQRRLCGAQRVSVQNVSRVLDGLNRVLPFVMREEADKDDRSAEARKLLRQFADSGRRVLTLEGNRLEMRWPMTESDYREAKNESRLGRAFQASGGVIDYADGVLVLTLGRRDAVRTTLTLPFSDKTYTSNAVGVAGRYGILESFDAEAAMRAFLDAPPRRD